jgi:hypothetical protein
MKRRITAGGVTIACAVVAAALILVAQVHRGSHAATALEVAERAYAHQSQVTAGLGPNTTVHEVIILHVTPEQARLNDEPVDTRSDGWWAFDANGSLSAYYARTTDMSGRTLVSTVELTPGGSLVQTNFGGATPESHVVVQHYALNAGDVASRFDEAVDTNKQRIASAGQPAKTDTQGNYLISSATERVHVDSRTYRILQVDELGPDGSVRESREYTQLDIADGNMVPTPSGVTTPSSPTPTPAR